jgi:hypothetical protein
MGVENLNELRLEVVAQNCKLNLTRPIPINTKFFEEMKERHLVNEIEYSNRFFWFPSRGSEGLMFQPEGTSSKEGKFVDQVVLSKHGKGLFLFGLPVPKVLKRTGEIKSFGLNKTTKCCNASEAILFEGDGWRSPNVGLFHSVSQELNGRVLKIAKPLVLPFLNSANPIFRKGFRYQGKIVISQYSEIVVWSVWAAKISELKSCLQLENRFNFKEDFRADIMLPIRSLNPLSQGTISQNLLTSRNVALENIREELMNLSYSKRTRAIIDF